MKKNLSSYPLLVNEWHPTLTGTLTPEDVSYGSKIKIWWLCDKGHSYDSMPNTRTAKNSTCPYCSGARVGEDNNLLTMFPEIAKEWHITKNEGLTPKDFTYGSNHKGWWICPEGHSYQSAITERTRRQKSTGCPYCDGKKASEENNFQKLFPEIAKEWHPKNNKELNSKNFTHGSKKKIW